VYESASLGGQSFAMFLCNQKTWNVKPLDDETAEKFRSACQELGYPSHLILPHGSYLMNPGAPDPEMLSKSRALFLDGLQRCDKLGIGLYNFHPGSSCGKIPVSECIDNIAESINYALANTNKVVAVIENMSKQGNTVGGDFKEIKKIIDRVKDKSRVGVFLDTCHTFAAGYDLRSDQAYEKTIQEFDSVIGLKYLKAIHLNDSKGEITLSNV
jgi:AP endonuclease-1